MGRSYRKNIEVSVPLRGLWFLSNQIEGMVGNRISLFPSPYGDYVSYPHPL